MEARRLSTPARPRRRLWCRALKGDERGSVSAELVLAAPLLLVLIMGVVQFALWSTPPTSLTPSPNRVSPSAVSKAKPQLPAKRSPKRPRPARHRRARGSRHHRHSHCHDHHRRSHRSRDKRRRLVLTAGQGSRVRADRGLRCGSGSSAMTLPGRLKREETGGVAPSSCC